MQFALLGDHPDGLDLAVSLAGTGRHGLAVYSGPAAGGERLRQHGLTVATVGDVEEVLADPAVEMVIVASRSAQRPALLRRALQAERHVLCVHPPDHTPEIAYEAAMIQRDTGKVLLPLLAEVLHPGVVRLAELLRAPAQPLGELRLIELQRWGQHSVWLAADRLGRKPTLPGWDVLRRLGGEIAEVVAFTAHEELIEDEPLLLSGRFERVGLFHLSLLPNQPEPRWRLAVFSSGGQAELVFPRGWPGPARLTWQPADSDSTQLSWDAADPWQPFIDVFEQAIGMKSAAGGGAETAAPSHAGKAPAEAPWPSWQDAVRSLELDDAARQSVQRRRASSLEYQEASEEVGFKGTMTLVGCGLLWLILLLLILANWLPWLGWLIGPVLGFFLLLQLFRWLIPGKRSS